MQRWRRLQQRSKTVLRYASGFIRYRRSCFAAAAGTVASCASVAQSSLSTEAEEVQPKEVLQFWFGDDYNSNSYEMQKKWFEGGPEMDEQIRAKFGDTVEKLLDPGTGSDYLKDWEADRESALALIIMLDQFTRNSYRKQAKAFDGDSRALRIALDGLGKGWWHQSPGVQPAFALMPLEHSEDIAHHKIMREAFLTLDLVKHTGGEESMLVAFLDKHTRLLEQFGRYPHRNEVLGRKSTPEEVEFLQGGGETFGQ